MQDPQQTPPVIQHVRDKLSNMLYGHFHNKERFEQFPKFKTCNYGLDIESNLQIRMEFDHSNKELSCSISDCRDFSKVIYSQLQFNGFIFQIYLDIVVDILFYKEQQKEHENRDKSSFHHREISKNEIKTGMLEHWENVDRRVYLQSTPQHSVSPIYEDFLESETPPSLRRSIEEHLSEQTNQVYETGIPQQTSISSEDLQNIGRMFRRPINRGFFDSINEVQPMNFPTGEIFSFRSSYETSKENGRTKRAKLKAEELLKNNLSSSQLYEYQTKKEFTVVGGTTKNLYTIKHGTQINIIDHSNNKKICFLPKNCELPGDVMLAQKISLENNETNALEISLGWKI